MEILITIESAHVEKQKVTVSNKKPHNYNLFQFFSCFSLFLGYNLKFILSDLLTCRRLTKTNNLAVEI